MTGLKTLLITAIHLLYFCFEAMHANILFRQIVAVSLVGWDALHASPIPSFVFLCTAVSHSVDEINNAMWCSDQK
jgi:hypothetical protein